MSLRSDSRLTREAEDFLAVWRDSSPTVTAYTSGSTGSPKRIELLKSDMRASAEATVRFFGLDGRSTLFLPLSPGYIAGKMQIVRAEEAGASLVVVEPSRGIVDGSMDLPPVIDLLPVVPPQIGALMGSPLAGVTRNVIVGGAPVTGSDESLLAAAPFDAYITYGMTETCSHVALRQAGDETYRALPGVEFTVDARGCLVIACRRMSFGRLVTNDVVELHSAREFRWIGRADNVINSGGIKIHPEEVEGLIAGMMPCGSRYYITGRPSRLWGTEAVLVMEGEADENDASLLARMRKVLPGHLVPKAIVHVGSIPRTASGKILRRSL